MITELRDNFHYIVVIILALVIYSLFRKSLGKATGLNTG